MSRPRKLAVGLIVVAALTGCRSNKSVPAGPAPDFQLKDLSGKTVSLSSFRGHPVMLDFWATWCGPCQMSIPLVQRFYMKNKDKGLVVLGMNVDEDPSEVPSFIKHFKMTYPVLLAGDSPVSDAYRIGGIPTFIFIDSEGRMVDHFEGFRYEMVNAWESDFEQMTSTTTH